MDDIKQNLDFNKDEFLHKLNSRLSSIWGYLQILQKKDIEDEGTKSLIEKAEKELREIINYVESAN